MGVSEFLVIACLVAILFSYKKWRFIGGTLANTVKGFKDGLKEDKRPEKDVTPHKKS